MFNTSNNGLNFMLETQILESAGVPPALAMTEAMLLTQSTGNQRACKQTSSLLLIEEEMLLMSTLGNQGNGNQQQANLLMTEELMLMNAMNNQQNQQRNQAQTAALGASLFSYAYADPSQQQHPMMFSQGYAQPSQYGSVPAPRSW